MKRKKTTFILLFVLPVIFLQQTKGQQNDFQVWSSATINLEVSEDLKLQLEEGYRLHENASQIDKQINDIGLSYRFSDYIKAALIYRLEADWINADEYKWRSGLSADLTLRYKPNRFTLGYRLRIQSSKIDRNDKQAYMFNGFRHRHKISFEYDIKGIPLTPFVDCELFVEQSAYRGSEISGVRYWAGLDYPIGKMHSFALKYGIDQEMNTTDPLRSFIIALEYTLDLKL
jgi:hypothetical protein